MNRIKRAIMALLLVAFIAGIAGCNFDYRSLLPKTPSLETPLIKVQIQFTDDEKVNCYVKSLGLDKDATVYAGGPSLNYMFDRDGNIIGSYNYQRVLYITILPEETSSD